MAATPRRIPAGLGRWGTDEFVEPHVRRLVAEHLGVGVEELVSEVSLRDDLAADSLDLVELALALEGEFAIVVPERILDEVRTFGDLVCATGLLIRARSEAEAYGAEPAPHVLARIVPAAGGSTGILVVQAHHACQPRCVAGGRTLEDIFRSTGTVTLRAACDAPLDV